VVARGLAASPGVGLIEEVDVAGGEVPLTVAAMKIFEPIPVVSVDLEVGGVWPNLGSGRL
jgi:hypothetical protein